MIYYGLLLSKSFNKAGSLERLGSQRGGSNEEI